jgi:HSP20 family molecular chaperone IbpA
MTTTTKELQKKEAGTPVERTTEARVYKPDVDIIERTDAIELMADMPGVDEKSLDVSFEDGLLTIRGKVDATLAEGACLSCAEYGVGDYERAFTVSDEIDAQGITATIKDGVLMLRLPKAERAKVRKIAVKGEG